MKLTVNPVGLPVVVTDQVYKLGMAPPLVSRLNEVHPPVVPGLLLVEDVTALQLTPIPPEERVRVV